MQSTINGASGIQVSVGGSAPYIPNLGLMSGTVRWNQNLMSLEIYDGSSWHPYRGPHYEISLTDEVNRLLQWVRLKIEEERKIKELAKSNPAINNAYKNFKKAEEQLQNTIILSTP